MKYNNRLQFIVSAFYWILLSALVYFSVIYLLPLLFPFIASFICAALLRKPTEILASRLRNISPRIIASFVILLFLAAFIFIIATAGIFLVNQLTLFLTDVPEVIGKLIGNATDNSDTGDFLSKLPGWLGKPLEEFWDRLRNDLSGTLIELFNYFSSFLSDSLSALGSFALKLPAFVVSFLVFVIALFYLGTDYCGAVLFVKSFIPDSTLKLFRRIRNTFSSVTLAMLRSYSLLMLITFIELLAGLLVIDLFLYDISHIFSVALVISFIDILPVLGVGAVLIPWGILDILGGNWVRGIALLVLYVLIAISRNILEPKIVGSSFGIHPVAMLLALYIGGKLFGFAGILFLPFLLVVAKQVFEKDVPAENAG